MASLFRDTASLEGGKEKGGHLTAERHQPNSEQEPVIISIFVIKTLISFEMGVFLYIHEAIVSITVSTSKF